MEYEANGATYGFKLWSAQNMTKLAEWTTTNTAADVYGGDNYENWCVGLVNGKVYTYSTAGTPNAIYRLTPVTLATEASFGNATFNRNDIDSVRLPLGLAPAVDVNGIGYIATIAIDRFGFMVFKEDLTPVACSNQALVERTAFESTNNFFGFTPDPVTGRARWWVNTENASTGERRAILLSYTPGTITSTGAENVTVTPVHTLNSADVAAFFLVTAPEIDPNTFQYLPCPDAGVLLVLAEVNQGTAIVALSLSDTTQVLWRNHYPNASFTEGGAFIVTDYGQSPITRGRYMAVGEIWYKSFSPYSQKSYLIDVQAGTILDSGDISSICSVGLGDARGFWNASTGRLVVSTATGSLEGIYSVQLDYDLGAGIGYGQDFDAPDNGVHGYRGAKLSRSNVTGTVNDYFEGLEEALKAYVDASGESYSAANVDMNNQKIVNLPEATAPDQLIRKSQAEALA